MWNYLANSFARRDNEDVWARDNTRALLTDESPKVFNGLKSFLPQTEVGEVLLLVGFSISTIQQYRPITSLYLQSKSVINLNKGYLENHPVYITLLFSLSISKEVQHENFLGGHLSILILLSSKHI